MKAQDTTTTITYCPKLDYLGDCLLGSEHMSISLEKKRFICVRTTAFSEVIRGQLQASWFSFGRGLSIESLTIVKQPSREKIWPRAIYLIGLAWG